MFSVDPVVSADGKWVAFFSRATNLVPGFATLNQVQLYIRNVDTNTTTPLSHALGMPMVGATMGVVTGAISISADGSRVAFRSKADLDGMSGSGVVQAWVNTTATTLNTRVSTKAMGTAEVSMSTLC